MNRNVVLFGASAVAGIVATAGLICGSQPSSAETIGRGVAWSTLGQSSSWMSGAVADSDGVFAATAAANRVRFSMPALGVSGIGVSVDCAAGKVVTTVTGGGAAGTYQPGQWVSASAFTGSPDVVGTVTFGARTVSGATVGAYYDLTDSGLGDYIALAGLSGCQAAPTTTPTSGPTTTGSPTTTTTTNTAPSPTSSVTTSPEPTSPAPSSPSPTNPVPTSPGSTNPTPTTSAPTPSAPVTGAPTPTSSETEPPAPSPITTSLPVTG